MAAAYDPPASTIPGRVIAYLRSLPPGTQVRTADLVAAINLELGPTAGMHNYMRAAVKNGAVVQHPDPDDRRRMLWWLGDGTPPDSADALPPDEPEAPLEPRQRRRGPTPRIDQLIVAGAPAVAKAMAALTTPAEFGTAQTVATSELRPGLRRVELDPPGLDQHAPGAKLDAGKVRAGLVLGGFARALLEVSKVGTYGAAKYTEHGWTQVDGGISRYDDAGMRHWLAEHAGQDADPDTLLLHAAHAAWNALARLDLMLREREITTTTKD